MLYAGATELSLASCQELARRLTEHVTVQTLNHTHEVSPFASHDARFLGALRSVADVVGHAPSTTEYVQEYDRRRKLGDTDLPSVSAVTKYFGGWPYALAAAGLMPGVPPSGIRRRQTYRRRVVHRYTDERLKECLHACTRDIKRIPMIRDYQAWREDKLTGGPGRRAPGADIPDRRTIHNRFGSWPKALEAAGLSGAYADRVSTTDYSEV